ncbi:MAG: hypothetical protein EOM20_19825, partial [Spartobacteria bacterium]|nr:hypothetical protein [Spartobacteria bacterium]
MKSGIAVLPLLALLLALVNPVAVHATSNDLVQAQSLGVYSPAHLFSTTDAALAAGEYNGILDEAWKWIKRFFNRYLDYNVEMVA